MIKRGFRAQPWQFNSSRSVNFPKIQQRGQSHCCQRLFVFGVDKATFQVYGSALRHSDNLFSWWTSTSFTWKTRGFSELLMWFQWSREWKNRCKMGPALTRASAYIGLHGPERKPKSYCEDREVEHVEEGLFKQPWDTMLMTAHLYALLSIISSPIRNQMWADLRTQLLKDFETLHRFCSDLYFCYRNG